MSEQCWLPAALTELYELLSAPRRCYVLRVLRETDDDWLSVRATAKRVASIEAGIPRSAVSGDTYRNVYNALTQTHLSKLAAANVISYDPNRKLITVGSEFQLLRRLLVITQALYRLESHHTVSDCQESKTNG
jgi:hypothetical protein